MDFKKYLDNFEEDVAKKLAEVEPIKPIDENVETVISNKIKDEPIDIVENKETKILEKRKEVARKEKILNEMVKKNNETTQNILEALTKLADLHERLLESNEKLSEKIDSISNIEIPPPVIQMVPPRTIKREVVRNKQGLIESIIDKEEHDEEDN